MTESDYPNLRALADANVLHGGMLPIDDLARALLAALDYAEAIDAAHEFMCKPVPTGEIEALAWEVTKKSLYAKAAKTGGKLAELEAEAGRG